MNEAELIKALTSKRTTDFWTKIRGTSIVFGVLGLLVVGALLYITIKWGVPSQDAHWGLVGVLVGYAAREAGALIQVAANRADESRPTVDVDTFTEVIRLVKSQPQPGKNP